MLNRPAIADLISSQLSHVTSLRRHLHSIPELLFEEQQTAAVVRAELSRLGIGFRGIDDTPTATIAHIGDTSRPCVALRADIDALPIAEATGLPYASCNPGKMHACGHDGHTASLLGAAAVLKAMEAELPVCVKLIFQPAEESGGGAERVVKGGAIDGRIGPKPRAIFGLHGWPALRLGTISTRAGALLASTDNFIATFKGKGSHGAYPHLGKDPIVAASEAVLTLQQIVSREVSPIEPAVVTVGRITGGTAFNIIPESASIEGTARALSVDTRKLLQDAIGRRVRGIAATHDMEVDFQWLEGYPPTINDPAEAQYAADVARKAFGPDAFIPAASASMGGEDFAYYLEKVPGCFVVVGVTPDGVSNAPGLHHPKYNFNDDALPITIRLLVELAIGKGRRPGT